MKQINIKHYGKLVSRTRFVKYYRYEFIVDERLDDIYKKFNMGVRKRAGIETGKINLFLNREFLEDGNHINFDISDDDENFINDKINKSEKVKSAYKEGEFEIVSKENIELYNIEL